MIINTNEGYRWLLLGVMRSQRAGFLGVKHLKSILKTKVVQRGENLENPLGESASRRVYMFTSPRATLSVADT